MKINKDTPPANPLVTNREFHLFAKEKKVSRRLHQEQNAYKLRNKFQFD